MRPSPLCYIVSCPSAAASLPLTRSARSRSNTGASSMHALPLSVSIIPHVSAAAPLSDAFPEARCPTSPQSAVHAPSLSATSSLALLLLPSCQMPSLRRGAQHRPEFGARIVHVSSMNHVLVPRGMNVSDPHYRLPKTYDAASAYSQV